MDFSKLSQNEQIAAGGGLVTLISGFLPWFSFGGIGSINGGGLMWLGILLTLAGVVILLMKVLDVQDINFGDVSAEQIAMILVGIGLVFLLLKALIGESLWSRSWGMFVGVIAAGAALFGVLQSNKAKGIGLPSANDFGGSGGTGSSGGGDPTTF